MKRLRIEFAPVLISLVSCAGLFGPPKDARVHVVSVQGVAAGDVIALLAADLEELEGVYRAEADLVSAELKIWSRPDVGTEVIAAVLTKRRQRGEFTAGKGTYLPPRGYPAGVDARVLTMRGSDVEDLSQHVVPGKVTVFDFYADWCGPCKVLDGRLSAILSARSDVAVRKLNIVGFGSPLARRFGLRIIPHVIVFGRTGKQIAALDGNDPTKIAIAIGRATIGKD